MNTYPGIYKALDGTIYYYLNKSTVFLPHREQWQKDEDVEDHKKDTNITREYLANTYGEVKSKEHAEFIVKLAEGHGFCFIRHYDYDDGDECFAFTDSHLYFWPFKSECDQKNKKLITIPLPPKEHEEDGMKQLERKLSAAMSTLEQLGYTYHGGELWKPPIAETIKEPEPKEWPQVGDEVLTESKQLAVVLAINSNIAWVMGLKQNPEVCAINYYGTVEIETLIKPLTPEEELAKEIKEMLSLTETAGKRVLLLMEKYDIKKKPE